MSRKHRVWFPGAKYHIITSRGNRRASIFYDDFDREAYFQFLEEARCYFLFISTHTVLLQTTFIFK
ncbi:hypothetical protein [Neobacillus cucumis]|uniref:hypothetical protein n=1 Tax=Neobacillus cucumis TaxID=1740721 RepID=UPI002E22006C|nr:hypothetical protein [Neobacillus cucumis]